MQKVEMDVEKRIPISSYILLRVYAGGVSTVFGSPRDIPRKRTPVNKIGEINHDSQETEQR
jgi:hypothetical protein